MPDRYQGLRDDLEKAAEEIAAAGHAGWGNVCREASDTIAALLKERDALLKDAERLDWLADNFVIEGFVAVSKDIYEFATDAAEKEGREEPAQSDQRVGPRLLIDAALADGEASK